MAHGTSAPRSAGLTAEETTAEVEVHEEYLSGSGSGPFEFKTLEQQPLCKKEKSHTNSLGISCSLF